jgi:hypothetical protein
LSQYPALSLTDHLPVKVLGIPERGVVFALGSILGGVVLSHLIERPFLSLRRKWFSDHPISPINNFPTPGTDAVENSSDVQAKNGRSFGGFALS